MAVDFFWYVVAPVTLVTLLYHLIPYRDLPAKKPLLALLPKYRTTIHWESDPPLLPHLAERMAKHGFKVIKTDESRMTFRRGYLLGDISIKLPRLHCTISAPRNGSSSLSIKGGWVIALDTGDLFIFLTELKDRIQKPPC